MKLDQTSPKKNARQFALLRFLEITYFQQEWKWSSQIFVFSAYVMLSSAPVVLNEKKTTN